MNHMDMVAEMLDVKMGEEFKIVDAEGKPYDGVFKFTEDGLKVKGHYKNINEERMSGWWGGNLDILNLLLTGKNSIVRKPWKPKKGETYYVIYANSKNETIIYYFKWQDTSACNEYYALGNCFRTMEEARQYASKYTEWLRNKKPDISWRD